MEEGGGALPRRKTLPKPSIAKAIAEHDYNAPENQEPPPEHVRELFRRFDANGDGVLEATEIRAVAAHMGVDLASEDAEALLAQYDADKSGAVDLAELASIIVELEELKAKQQGQLGPLDA